MASGKYTVLVDWNNDGDFTDSNDDVTSNVMDISWTRGRDYASQLEGESIAGLLKVRLLNTTGLYSPSNTSGALTGNLKPGRSIKVNGGTGSFPYTFPIVFDNNTLWAGRIEKITPSPASAELNTCQIEAFGVLGYLNDFRPSLATLSNRRTDQAIGDILDDVGWPSGDRDLATGQTTITRFWIDGPQTIDALRTVEQTEAGFVKETKDGKIAFESRHTRLASPYTTSQATFSDASGSARTYMSADQIDPLGTVVNNVEASSVTYNTASVAALWTHPETGSSSPTLVPAESKTFEATYPNRNSANNAVEVDAWTTPAATTDILANTASDGSGTNRTSSITISAAKTATRMLITLTNGHATDTVYLTKIQARGTAVTSNDPVVVRTVDSTSQSSFGERKFVATTPFIPTSVEAQSWCDYHAAVFGTPVEILTMNISANVSEANMYQVLTRDISDRITVVATNDAKLGINADFFIESESHHVTPGKVHMVTWKLSPASGGYSQFWILGTGKLGSNTVPAY
jgi:hypothetical protein